MAQYRFYATAPRGAEPALSWELERMGATEIEESRSGVYFSGTLEIAYRACLELRTAQRVLLPIKTFPAADPDALYRGVRSIHWTEHLSPDGTLAVDFVSSDSKITHTHFGALKTKDAIVDQFRAVKGRRPSVDPRTPDLRINVYVHRDEATVAVDLSGDSLHRRGYRSPGAGAAPLKETLAAALLITAGWPEIAEAGGAFYDPMCGSGTLVIEAAWIALGRAPGLLRGEPASRRWLGFDEGLWQKAREHARSLENPMRARKARYYGSDADASACRATELHAHSARVGSLVRVERRELRDITKPNGHEKGLLMMNPPYGDRIGEETDLVPLYREIGDVMKQRFNGWKGAVLTGSRELSKNIGLKASRRHVFFNGPIECRLFEFQLY